MAELAELERLLSSSSHTAQDLEHIQQFCVGLKNSAERMAVFNAAGALVRTPITCEETKALGFTLEEDQFTLLQGDILTTEAAYFLGERVTNGPKYMALNSSCDLVPDRRKYAMLLRIKEILTRDAEVRAKLNLLLTFKRREAMYLPALDTDSKSVACNAVEFDGICQIKSGDLLLARRIASLSLIGWRIFGCFSKVVIARANDRESEMRRAVETQPRQTIFDNMQ